MEYKELFQILTRLGFVEGKYSGHGNRIIWSKEIGSGELIVHWHNMFPDCYDLEFKQDDEWVRLIDDFDPSYLEIFIHSFQIMIKNGN